MQYLLDKVNLLLESLRKVREEFSNRREHVDAMRAEVDKKAKLYNVFAILPPRLALDPYLQLLDDVEKELLEEKSSLESGKAEKGVGKSLRKLEESFLVSSSRFRISLGTEESQVGSVLGQLISAEARGILKPRKEENTPSESRPEGKMEATHLDPSSESQVDAEDSAISNAATSLNVEDSTKKETAGEQ